MFYIVLLQGFQFKALWKRLASFFLLGEKLSGKALKPLIHPCIHAFSFFLWIYSDYFYIQGMIMEAKVNEKVFHPGLESAQSNFQTSPIPVTMKETVCVKGVKQQSSELNSQVSSSSASQQLRPPALPV